MRRALLVDLFSTLVPGGNAERDVIHQKMSAVLGVDAAAFSREFAATSYERFTGAYGDLPSTLRVIAQRTGADPTDEQVREATSLRRKLSRRLLNAAPAGTLSALAGLRSAGWRIGLVSNITSETQLQWADSPLPPYFETTAFSAEVGAAKPEPEIYLAACNALGVAPADCVYIGDGNDKELPAAAALGMYAIRTIEHSDSDPTWTGPTVSSFTELPDLIGVPA
ncbi:putative hydrolase of the HAD superfamily [Kribbella steppae]|uniref:Putative hydrolase of the HAD superfamily n=1 Tax=Kribbella steppae TaxID=2512223 RepID=A0A4R2HGS4_9ACTN|nr:HAD family hydrolase [Kribbella steppae]TCO28374.1 putative hydrolase of the HAD superfamily [Kribbella steppae]